jgi:hypothetical protein
MRAGFEGAIHACAAWQLQDNNFSSCERRHKGGFAPAGGREINDLVSFGTGSERIGDESTQNKVLVLFHTTSGVVALVYCNRLNRPDRLSAAAILSSREGKTAVKLQWDLWLTDCKCGFFGADREQ